MVLARPRHCNRLPSKYRPSGYVWGTIPPPERAIARFRLAGVRARLEGVFRMHRMPRSRRVLALCARGERAGAPLPAPASAALSSSKAGAKHVALTISFTNRAAVRPPDGHPHAGGDAAREGQRPDDDRRAAAVTVGGKAVSSVGVAGRAVTISLAAAARDDVRLDHDRLAKIVVPARRGARQSRARRAPTPSAIDARRRGASRAAAHDPTPSCSGAQRVTRTSAKISAS